MPTVGTSLSQKTRAKNRAEHEDNTKTQCRTAKNTTAEGTIGSIVTSTRLPKTRGVLLKEKQWMRAHPQNEAQTQTGHRGSYETRS